MPTKLANPITLLELRDLPKHDKVYGIMIYKVVTGGKTTNTRWQVSAIYGKRYANAWQTTTWEYLNEIEAVTKYQRTVDEKKAGGYTPLTSTILAKNMSTILVKNMTAALHAIAPVTSMGATTVPGKPLAVWDTLAAGVCEVCEWQGNEWSADEQEAFGTVKCKCNFRVGIHSKSHPHLRATCSGFGATEESLATARARLNPPGDCSVCKAIKQEKPLTGQCVNCWLPIEHHAKAHPHQSFYCAEWLAADFGQTKPPPKPSPDHPCGSCGVTMSVHNASASGHLWTWHCNHCGLDSHRWALRHRPDCSYGKLMAAASKAGEELAAQRKQNRQMRSVEIADFDFD